MKFVYGEEEINITKSMSEAGGWPVITRKDLFKSIKYNGKELIPEKTIDPIDWENLFKEVGMEVTDFYKSQFFIYLLATDKETSKWNSDYILTDEDILGRPLQANDEIVLEVEFKNNIEDLSALTCGIGIGLKEISSNLFENCTNVTNFAYAFDNSMINITSHVYDSKLESSCPIDKDGTPLYLRSTEKKDGYAIVKQPERCFGGCSKMSDFDEIPAPWGGNNFDDCKIIIETSGFDSEFPGYFKERLENGEFTKYILSSGANGFNAPYGFSVGMDRISKRPVVISSITFKDYSTSQITDMSKMFYFCNGLTNLDVSSFDTSNVTNMSYMFGGCISLTSLNVSSFDTSGVTNMSYMFGGCISLTSLNVSSFDTSGVTDMGWMFYGCSGLASLDLEHFDTSNVTDMGWMFNGCSGLTSLDLSNFNTSNVTSMGYMFKDCTSLSKIKCTQAFKDWCITNKDTIKLPDTMVNGTVGAVGSGSNWEIVDYTPQP